jgi:SAM-dependent methyltransferase
MYGRSARFYDRIYGGSGEQVLRDARLEAARVVEEVEKGNPAARTLLDVACATGRYLPFLAPNFSIRGIDLNADLIAIARERNPDATFDVADMTDFDLAQRFDVITCLFSSIAYVVTAERLEAAVRRMAAHLEPGGIVIIEPWFTPDTFWDGHVALNQIDEPDFKVAWMYRQERVDRISALPIHYLLGTADGGVEHFTERHELGLFSHQQYTTAMESVGLRVSFDPEAFGRGLYVGIAAR